MRIIHEDNNTLTFKVYPDKLITFGLFFLIAIAAYGLIYLSRDTYEILINAFLLGLLVAHAIITFLLPLTVKIDKSTGTLTYFYLSIFTYIFPSKIKKIFRNNPTLTIKINHLKRIEEKNIFDGILKPTFSNVLTYLDTEGVSVYNL